MNTPQNDAVAYSVTDAARYAGIGRSTLYNALAAGELPARKLGKRTLILRDDLRDWIAAAPAFSDETKASGPTVRKVA